MSKAYPTPWTFEAEDVFEDSPIRAANREFVLVRDNGVYPPDLETCREIVEAVNWYCNWGALSAELERLRNERDRLRDIVRNAVETLEQVYKHADMTDALREVVAETQREACAALGEDR